MFLADDQDLRKKNTQPNPMWHGRIKGYYLRVADPDIASTLIDTPDTRATAGSQASRALHRPINLDPSLSMPEKGSEPGDKGSVDLA